jgi:type VI secretion system protein ImpB
MTKKSSQKFIGKKRPPRVHIEYDVELYGSDKRVDLPFVMGVMSDLSGESKVQKRKVVDRKFLRVDAYNFEDCMKAIKPGANFRVPNTLTGEGDLRVDLDFERMEDFEPGKVVQKVDALNKLMKTRKELSNLMSYMDGKTDAEDLIGTVLQDPALLSSLSDIAKSTEKVDKSKK